MSWQQIYGERNTYEDGRSIIETADGYIIGGTVTDTSNTAEGQTNAGIMKISKDEKTVLWSKIYASIGYGAIRSVILDKTNSRHIVATGYIESKENKSVPFVSDDSKGILIKVDSKTGVLILEKLLSSSTLVTETISQGAKIKNDAHDASGGYVICTTTQRDKEGTEHYDATLIKTSADLVPQWIQFYGGTSKGNLDQCFDFEIATDGYMLAGHSTSYGKGDWDGWLLHTDTQGAIVSSKTFGQPLGEAQVAHSVYDECYGIKKTADNGFIIACGSGIEPENVPHFSKDPLQTWVAYVVRTNSVGTELWNYVYRANNHNAAEYVTLADDGSYIIFLDSDSLGTEHTEANIGFLKIKEE